MAEVVKRRFTAPCDHEQQALLVGPADVVWMHDSTLLASLEKSTMTLDERPSVHVAALDHVSAHPRCSTNKLASKRSTKVVPNHFQQLLLTRYYIHLLFRV